MTHKCFGLLGLAIIAAPAGGKPAQAVDCGAVLDRPGHYQLTEDLSCPLGFPPPAFCDSAAITVTAPKVHLDGNGFTVAGNQTGVGIRIATTKAKVRNIGVESFDVGIEVAGGGSHHLTDLVSTRNSDFHCGNGVGIEMTGTAGNRVERSDISQNERWGVRRVSSEDNRLHHDRIIANRFRPGSESGNVDLSSAHRNRIVGNDLSHGGVFGIRLMGSDDNVIAANLLAETGTQAGFGTAISLESSVENWLQANWIDREPPPGPTVGFIGIHLFTGALRSLVRGNSVFDHTAGGIVVVLGATENRLQSNEAFDNTPWDAEDENPDCDANLWRTNRFGVVSQPACID
jgi:parallel beta-helix repeat protein